MMQRPWKIGLNGIGTWQIFYFNKGDNFCDSCLLSDTLCRFWEWVYSDRKEYFQEGSIIKKKRFIPLGRKDYFLLE